MPSAALVHALWRGRGNKIASAFVRAYGIRRTKEIVAIRPRKRQFTKKRKTSKHNQQQPQQQPPQILALVPDFLAIQPPPPPQQQQLEHQNSTDRRSALIIDAAFDAFSDAVRAWPSPTAHFFVSDPLPSFADAFAALDDWAAAAPGVGVSSP
jgi:hypothetical protein